MVIEAIFSRTGNELRDFDPPTDDLPYVEPSHAGRGADQNGHVGGNASLGGMAGWHEVALVGRDGLIAELTAAARAAALGEGSIVVLTGEAGIGKTSVARAVARAARDTVAVTWGSCIADQSAPPFWPWRALARPDLSGAGNEMLPAIGASRFELLSAMRDQIDEHARRQPRLHVIEDLQWADVASVLLLGHLATTISEIALFVVATLRTGEPLSDQLAHAIEAVRRTAPAHELRAFDARDVATMVRNAGIATDADKELVERVLSRTGGNPLLVSELLRGVAAERIWQRQLATVAETVPAGVADLTRQRLARLPPAVAEVLVTASVIGLEGGSSMLAVVHGADHGDIVDLLDQARAARFLDAADAGRWRFRHQLIRDAVYAGLPANDRARRHAEVVDVLAADRSTPPATIARHALAAIPVIDTDRAIELAARAGEDAFAHHAYEEAIEWFRHALAAAPAGSASRRAELLVLSGEAHRHTGDTRGARSAFVAASELTDEPALLARAALGYADPGADLGIAYRSGDPTTARLLERAIAAQSQGDSLIGVRLEARLAAELYFSDQPTRARELAASALARAERLDDPRALGAATAVAHDAYVIGSAGLDEQLAQSAQLVDWARASGSVAALLSAHRARVFDLLSAGDVAAMDAEIIAFRRLAEPLRAPGYLWWPAVWSAMRALLEGRHELAEQRAMEAYRIGGTPFSTLAFLNLSFLLFFLRREQGRLGEMEQATRDHAASHADVPAIRVALAMLLAETGQIDQARDALAAFDQRALSRLRDRNWPASWFQLARAAAIVGDRNFAATLLEPRFRPSERCVQVSLATVCLGATDLAVAWLLHTVGDLDAADSHYRAAEDLNARIAARSWLAQARADHARLLVERDGPGDRAEASGLDELAATAARELGLGTVVTAKPAEPAARESGRSARFRRDGAVWDVRFGDGSVQLPDALGLRDLAYLLARPGVPVSVMELAAGGEDARLSARGARAFDARARREIRDRLHELDLEEADAEALNDGERATRAREQRQALAEIVARDLGLGGRTRLIGDPAERTRKTVSARIRRTISSVGRLHPQLARHLERSIDTGAWCAYRPAEPVDWET